jgi:3-hydroxyacyl-CoA dehydrogenase
MPDVVHYAVEDGIAVITIDNPPVNAMSHAVRSGVCDAVDRFARDSGAKAAVLICAGRTFVAGADITEFDRPPQDPWLPEVVHRLEAAPKTIVAAIHGTALGGGLETASGCHYRCALPSAKVGLPEVNLGLLPGAGGTQRLPRLSGVRRALDLMIAGKPIGAVEAKDCGIIDEIVDGDLRAAAIAYARRLVADNAPPRRVSDLAVDAAEATPEFFADYRREIAARTRGFFAPEQIIRCVEAAVSMPYADALKLERRLFDECKQSIQSRAQRHLFFAEREVARIPDIPKDTPVREIGRAAVIGAGTMGTGIAITFADAGIPVTLLEADRAGLDRGLGRIRDHYAAAVDKGRMSSAQMEQRLALLAGTMDHADLAQADVVIEAVFESMAVKQQVFRQLDTACRPGAVLASNTSTLNLDVIAAATRRPQDIVGLHFFAPANVMPLLEIVRGAKTGPDVIATAMAVAKRIRKIGVLSGVCFGFIGNRMFVPYIREAQLLLLEGVPAERVDRVAVDWGMAMGPLAVCDLSGLDVFRKLFDEWQDRPVDPSFCRVGLVLSESGRLGQKTGAGFYRYEGRKALPDAEVAAIARREGQALGIERREVGDAEIGERLLYSMINEGARILEEGIALRPGDIDVVYANGYGFPRYRGGPMFYADTVGPRTVYDGICRYRERYGDTWWTPAPLLERLADEGWSFADWHRARSGVQGDRQ